MLCALPELASSRPVLDAALEKAQVGLPALLLLAVCGLKPVVPSCLHLGIKCGLYVRAPPWTPPSCLLSPVGWLSLTARCSRGTFKLCS